MKKLTLFLVAMLFSTLSFAALNPYAYGLKSKLSDDEKTVTITYKLNAPATAVNVVVLDGETVLRTVSSDGITQGEHNVAISTDGFPKGKTLSWKVEVKGAGVTDVECTNDISGTTTKYKFYRPQGVAVDNNPESDFFGRIYIALPRGGYDHTKGVVVFDPVHNVLSNSGITATGVALASDDTYGMHRIAVNPTNGKVYYAKSETSTAIYELTPDATNILSDGGTAKNVISGMSTITNANSLCFDKNGAMYVLGNAGYASATDTYTGKIYKIENGTISEFTKEYYRWASKDNSIVSDERGGFWVAQQRTNFDGCDVLAHVNSNGTRDYKITSTVNNTLLPTKKSGSSTNASYRGQVAHYLIDGNNGILAFGGGGKVSIFKVTYAADEVPTLTAWKTISLKSTSWKANVDGLAFDYAGNLIVMSATDERFGHYALPKDNNTCVTPCPTAESIVIPADPQLNPFAYNLTSELSADEKNLTINYSLNAKATSVNWVLMDGNNVVKTIDLASLGLEKGDYTTTIPTTDFPQYKQLTWKIEVKGVAVNEPTYVKSVNFYRPFGIDIDNNTENKHFGRILCGETYTSSNTKYESYGVGAGIYEYSPAFELKPNGTKPGYNGGKTFTEHSPYRIRISEDGRIFVTAHDKAGDFLWEVNPENLNEWTSVFKGATHNADKLLDASGKFIAGTNAGFDVHGKGENLQLLMLSCDNLGTNAANFQCHEYNLGTAKTWSAIPSKAISGSQLYNTMISRYSQVTYDNEGGFWEVYYVNTTLLGGIAHFAKKADGSFIKDYEEHKIMLRAGGCVFNHDFSKLLLCGDINVNTNNPGLAVVYNVSKNASGKPVLTKETTIDVIGVVGGNLNDFAWDYANNIYAIGNNGEKLAVYALPHSSEDVVATPAASKYAFSIGKYTVTVNTNDVNKGTVTGGGEYGAGAVVTLTATPKEGYELLYWSDRSKENPRTITVDGNEALSAYFIKKNDIEPTFSITKVWENTNVPASTNNGYQGAGWDGKIYVKDRLNNKILVYSETGYSPYVEFGGSYEGLAGDQAITMDDAGNMIIRSGSAFFYDAPSQISIFKKGETTYKTIDFTLPETGRCDFISASGDLFSAEGGYVYFYCQNKSGVSRLHVKNGGATTSDVTVDFVGNITTLGNTQSHVMADIFGNLVTHSRTNPITTTINAHTGESMNFTLPNNHKANALGGCSFELAGKEFWAFNVKGTNTCTSEWNLYNLTDGAFVSSDILYAKNTTDKNSAANWLNVQVVDEKTAYIYQFCPTVAAAVWKVTRDHIVSATAENGTVAGTGSYKDNATATLTATPNDGYLFKNWTKNGVVVSTENPYSFTVTEDVELVANFDGPFCELILNTNDEAKGTVSGEGLYRPGQTATITATPKAGYKLLYWSDRSTQATRTITMNKKEALSAYFVKEYDVEPTFAIEKVWENTNVPASGSGYQAVGWDGKIYMQNKTAGKIQVYTNDTDAAVDYATSNTSGQQIAVDEVGNLIVFNAYFASATPNAIQIFRKDNTSAKAIEFTLPNPGRCDFISASGDIFSAEGGYVYFYCNTQNVVNRVKITNGELTSIDAIGNTKYAASSTSHVMMDIFGNLAAHCRSTAVDAINSYTGETTTFNTSLSGIKLSTLGGCSFELGGKELWAYNVGTTHYNSEWNLYNMTDKEFLSDETLYAKDKTSRMTQGAANWLNVQVVDEKTAYIYQFCPTVGVALWKVTCTTEKTVTVDENADNTTALEDFEGEVVTATVKRNFAPNSVLTLTLPFDMDAAQIRNVFGNAKVYEFANVLEDEYEIHLQFSSTTSIAAGKPYILVTQSTGGYDAEDGFTIDNVTINTTPNPVSVGAITMVPALDAGGTLDQPNQFYLSGGGLYNAGTYNMNIVGLRAYFESTSPLPVRARVVFQDNEATSIPMVEAQPETKARKVLKNGRIIIIRGEQQYTIQGQRID